MSFEVDSLYIIIECDNCGEQEEIELVEWTAQPLRFGLPTPYLPEDWEEENGEHFCNECLAPKCFECGEVEEDCICDLDDDEDEDDTEEFEEE